MLQSGAALPRLVRVPNLPTALVAETVRSELEGELYGEFTVGAAHQWRVFLRLGSRAGGRPLIEIGIRSMASTPGGIGTRTLRDLPLAQMQSDLRFAEAATMERAASGEPLTFTFYDENGRRVGIGEAYASPDLAAELAAQAAEDRAASTRGPKPISSRELAQFATRYCAALGPGGSPIASLVNVGPDYLSRWQVTSRVREARRRGLLTPTAQGRAGGELTDKARAILATTEGD